MTDVNINQPGSPPLPQVRIPTSITDIYWWVFGLSNLQPNFSGTNTQLLKFKRDEAPISSNDVGAAPVTDSVQEATLQNISINALTNRGFNPRTARTAFMYGVESWMVDAESENPNRVLQIAETGRGINSYSPHFTSALYFPGGFLGFFSQTNIDPAQRPSRIDGTKKLSLYKPVTETFDLIVPEMYPWDTDLNLMESYCKNLVRQYQSCLGIPVNRICPVIMYEFAASVSDPSLTGSMISATQNQRIFNAFASVGITKMGVFGSLEQPSHGTKAQAFVNQFK